MSALEMKLELKNRIGALEDEGILAQILRYVKSVSGSDVETDLIDKVVRTAPKNVPLSEEDIMNEIKAVRYVA